MKTKTSVRTEYSAGGIVFRKLKRGVEVAFILDPFDRWTFPKGHIEKGELISRAAVRETKEEMGIGRVKIIASLGKIDWWFAEKRSRAHSPRGARVHKFAHYFLMQVPYQTQLRPQKSEFIKAARWVPLKQSIKLSGYKDIEPVLRKAVAILQQYDTPARKSN